MSIKMRIKVGLFIPPWGNSSLPAAIYIKNYTLEKLEMENKKKIVDFSFSDHNLYQRSPYL